MRVKERENVTYGWLIPNPKTSQTIYINFRHLLNLTISYLVPELTISNLIPKVNQL